MWTNGEILEVSLNLILLAVPVVFIIYVVMEGLEFYYSMPLTILIGSIVMLGIIRDMVNSRRLTRVEHNLDDEEIRILIKAISIDKEWILLNSNKRYALLHKSVMWQWEGFRITILKQNRTVWINSIIEPSLRSNPINWGINKKNLEAILNYFELAESDVDVLELAKKRAEQRRINDINSPEWRGKNLIMRLIILPFLLALVGISMMLLYFEGMSALPISILLLSVALVYVYVDIKTIKFNQNNRDRS